MSRTGAAVLSVSLVTALAIGGGGCRAHAAASGGPNASGPTSAPTNSNPEPAASGSNGSSASAAPSGSGSAAAATPLPEPREPTAAEKARHLPELVVEYIGLHVGGGPNDAAGKAPFERALAAQFEAFAACYRAVEDPEHGGNFGVDLFIGRDGGHPSVRQVRTRMKGDAFSSCMVAAFEAAKFDKPHKGPTQISYSVRFTLGGSH